MKNLAALVSVAAVLSALVLPAHGEDPGARKVRIVLAGDSTVTDNAGWGTGFAKATNDSAEVINLARGGRSSKSFRDEGLWKQVLDAKPDYVLIQFGHNDQPGKGPARETDPKTTFRANLARYVDEARAAGAKPVLLTSLSRRRWDDKGIHIRSDLTDYVEATRAVAAGKKVPLIDLHARSIEVYESLRPAGCELISPRNKDGGTDHTHLNLVGSEVFGPIVAWDLKRALPELSPHLRGYIPAEKRAATTQPTTVPTTGPAARQLAAPAGEPTRKGARTITVAADGGGDFTTVQEAIAAVADDNADRTTIRIRAGVYTGPFVVPRAKQNVTFAGDGADKTILTYALNVTDPIPAGVPTKMGGNGTIVLADGFHARDLTFRNTSGDHGQAMALRVQGDRGVITNCRLLGWQDTLLAHSKRQYFRDCLIEGRVDFIYGASTAVFDRCEIRSKEGGYVTAASTPKENPFGFVFLDCKLTGDGEPQAYLGRPWRDFAAVAFLRCAMGDHVKPQGWHNWGKPQREKTARYAEYKNTGPGADRAQRVEWSKELSDAEAARYTVANVLGGADGWAPTKSAASTAAATVPAATAPAAPGVPAFPGAEGFGASATGGRGGAVYEVTNLDDAGPGSLRDALSGGDRTVVFRVSGTIDLKTQIRLNKPNVTIAGQTAPGDGICLKGKELMIVDTENVVVRFLRLRPGDELRQEHDALSIRNSQRVIVDHCSMSWSTDSLNDVTHTSGNVTVQWCLLAEPLNASVHVKGAHGYGTGWDGRIIDDPVRGRTGGGGSYHHNLLAHCASRAPRIGYYQAGRGLIDCRNNVIYNSGPSYGGEGDDLNYVANYYRPGPASPALRKPPGNLFDVWSDDTRMYVDGNVFEGMPVVARDNAAHLTFKKGHRAAVIVAEPFTVAPVATDPADEALRRVIDSAGATLPTRDAVDARIVGDVRNRTGRIINSQADVGGWPTLASAPPPRDADHDGMPDEWETARGLDPNDATDGARAAQDGYTHLEHYLNALAAKTGER